MIMCLDDQSDLKLLKSSSLGHCQLSFSELHALQSTGLKGCSIRVVLFRMAH